jgi:hypothetical protein
MTDPYKKNNEKARIRATGKRPSVQKENGLNKGDVRPELNEWTILIYHSGETSLSEELIWSLKEMARVGTPDKVEVIALMDSISLDLWRFTISNHRGNPGMPASKSPKPPESTEVEEGGIFHSEKLGPKRNPLIQSVKEQFAKEFPGIGRNILSHWNLASYDFLLNFIVQTITEHPAKHYMLILSGHGDGMIGETLLMDQGAGRFLSVPKLNDVLENVAKVIKTISKSYELDEQDLDPRLAILGFDACGMLTAEVSHLLSEEVKYIVGSEGIMDKSGWPYHLILDFLKTHPDAKPEALATATVQRCVNYYADFGRVGLSIDMAAIQMSPLRKKNSPWNKLITAIKNLVEKLSNSIHDRNITNAVITAHWYAQSYGSEHYVDLLDFCEQLKSAAPELNKLCTAVVNALDKVVIQSCHSGSEFQHSHGLSLYFPWCATDRELNRYSRFVVEKEKKVHKTPFNLATGWGEFLWDFTYATRRKPSKGQEGLIFMPPPGYRKHLSDLHSILPENKEKQALKFFTTCPTPSERDDALRPRDDQSDDRNNDPNGRNADPNPRNADPNPRNADPNPRLGLGKIAFSKFKNPSMVFREIQYKGLNEKEEKTNT